MNILDQNIKYLPGMGPRRTEILQKELGISTWGQLLEYYPYKYVDRSHIYSIDELQPDMPFVQLKGKICRLRSSVRDHARNALLVTSATDMGW